MTAVSFLSAQSEIINKYSSLAWIRLEYLCAMHADRFIASMGIFIKNSNFVKLLNKSVGNNLFLGFQFAFIHFLSYLVARKGDGNQLYNFERATCFSLDRKRIPSSLARTALRSEEPQEVTAMAE